MSIYRIRGYNVTHITPISMGTGTGKDFVKEVYPPNPLSLFLKIAKSL